MDTAPGTRGIVIGDRYRVAGALRRTGLVDAVDLEADRTEAACRVVGVPGDAERVDAWEDAWRAAQGDARLPRLREVVADDDGAHWAVLAPSRAAGLPLPAEARVQARAIGEALAGADLDIGDVTPAMLVTAEDGRLCLDGTVWLGGGHTARAAGNALVGLLPPAPESDAAEAASDSWAPPRRTAPRRSQRLRVLVPVAIAATLAAAVLVLLAPTRSGGTAVVAPGAATGADDALLASMQYPVDASPSTALASAIGGRPGDDGRDAPAEPVAPDGLDATDAALPEPPATVTIMVPAAAEPAIEPLPEPVAPALPVAAAERAPELPTPESAPSLPVAGGG